MGVAAPPTEEVAQAEVVKDEEANELAEQETVEPAEQAAEGEGESSERRTPSCNAKKNWSHLQIVRHKKSPWAALSSRATAGSASPSSRPRPRPPARPAPQSPAPPTRSPPRP